MSDAPGIKNNSGWSKDDIIQLIALLIGVPAAVPAMILFRSWIKKRCTNRNCKFPGYNFEYLSVFASLLASSIFSSQAHAILLCCFIPPVVSNIGLACVLILAAE